MANDLIAYSADHLLGTDKLGRDILSRTLHGARISLAVGFATVALSLAIGLLVGSLAGYFGGWVDLLLMRLVDILLAFPGILLAIAFTAVLGPGLDHVVLAL
ncbi:MAG TPA: ABC transporter permease, partial [Roseiflexaceae bacterium]|nr:ABC transporter permease [Roseiflexaceae bacterium]